MLHRLRFLYGVLMVPEVRPASLAERLVYWGGTTPSEHLNFSTALGAYWFHQLPSFGFGLMQGPVIPRPHWFLLDKTQAPWLPLW